jgi:hypothetical protein
MIDPKTLASLPDDALTRTEFRDTLVPLSRLVEMRMEAGQAGGVNGNVFVGCVIRGPGVVVPDSETNFDRCIMGETHGDIRNLFVLSQGPRISGAIAVHGCRFESCQFVGIGFAGDQGFVDHFVSNLSGKAGAAA